MFISNKKNYFDWKFIENKSNQIDFNSVAYLF